MFGQVVNVGEGVCGGGRKLAGSFVCICIRWVAVGSHYCLSVGHRAFGAFSVVWIGFFQLILGLCPVERSALLLVVEE